MKIQSSAFGTNEKIPSKYTCDCENISPPLTISDIPPKAKTIILILDDPDAPSKTWVHQIAFNIPVAGGILEIPESQTLGTSGINDFNSLGYGGPCPPSGTHRYFFKSFAVDSKLDLQEGATKEQVEQAMQGRVLDNAEFIGLYEKE